MSWRPSGKYVKELWNSYEYYHNQTSDRDAAELAEGWRRAHALASLRACLGVLAFVAELQPTGKEP